MKTRKSQWTILVCLVAALAITISTSAQTITTFDVPGDVGGTYPTIVIESGAITGFSVDGAGVSHCFLRAPGGSITTFDFPGWGGSVGTQCPSMNDSGTIAGLYSDAADHIHGFVRDRHGTVHHRGLPGLNSHDRYKYQSGRYGRWSLP